MSSNCCVMVFKSCKILFGKTISLCQDEKERFWSSWKKWNSLPRGACCVFCEVEWPFRPLHNSRKIVINKPKALIFILFWRWDVPSFIVQLSKATAQLWPEYQAKMLSRMSNLGSKFDQMRAFEIMSKTCLAGKSSSQRSASKVTSSSAHRAAARAMCVSLVAVCCRPCDLLCQRDEKCIKLRKTI